MKKVLSFVLVLALVLGSFSMAFAAPADVAGTDCEKAVAALTELGVVTGYPDGKYKPENAVNRAEAAKLVITALGLAEYAEGNTASFTDLAGYGWAEGYIGYAEALGILKGDGNGLYRPADTVSYQEMATMLVRACGYTDASLPGTWPANYVVKAKALGIMDGIANAGSAAANRGDVAIMLYNNLDNAIGTINLDNQWIANTPADSMMARLETAVYASGAAFVLDNTDNIADDAEVAEYYGAYVVAYANGDNEISSIKEVKSTFLTGKFTTTGALKFIANDITYDVTSTVDVVKLNNGLYNGTTAAITTSNAVSNEVTLAVDLSGKKIKEVYSMADWSGTSYVWSDAYAKQLSKNDTLAGNAFVMNDNNEIDMTSFALVGVDSLDKIAKDNIVTVYVNGKITKVEVSAKTVEGKVTKVTSDSKYVINGTGYKKASATGGDTTDVTLGAEGTFYLNYAGKIVNFDGVAETANYAVVANGIKEYKEAGYDTTTKYAIELFTAEGQQKVFTIDKDVVVTGAAAESVVSYGAVTNAATTIENDVIIAYTLDEDGVIDSIEVPAQNSAVTKKYTAKGFLDGVEVADNAVVFTGTAAGEDLALAKIADLPVNEALIGTYYVVEDSKVVAIIANETVADSTYGVLVGYAEVKNADNKTVTEVTMLVNGVEVTYLSTYADKATVDSALVNTTSLFAIGLTDGEISSLVATDVAVTTVVAIKNGSIDTTASVGYEQVSDSVVVYEITVKADGSFDKMVASDLASIVEDDQVYLFETNSDDGHEGYDIIIFKAN